MANDWGGGSGGGGIKAPCENTVADCRDERVGTVEAASLP